ncbi:MAG: zinc-binding dehydrogenase [Planctomycetota bacterium]
MRRIAIHRPGAYDRLMLEECATPGPGPGQVRIAVGAAGVNYADTSVRMGLYSSAKENVGWPITPGFEWAGKVDACGEGVSDLQIGADVYGVSLFGAYASHVVVPRYCVYPRPPSLALEQAGGFPAVALTAWYALCDLAHPRPGHTLLVHSAAGGVGGMLLQVGRALGCRTIGVVGAPHKVAVAESLGADVVIDKSREDLWARVKQESPPGGVHVALDANGVSTLWQSYVHMRKPGKLVCYGFSSMLPKRGGRITLLGMLRLIRLYLRTPRFNPFKMSNSSKCVMCFNLSYMFEEQGLLEDGMTRLAGWLESGQLKPLPVQTYPLEQVGEAHRAIESGQTTGKLVLIP